MMPHLLTTLLLLRVAPLLAGPAHAAGPGGGKTEATVYCKTAAASSCSLSLGVLDATGKGSAWGTFEDSLNTTGWGVLNIKTRPHAAGAAGLAYFAAGMVEGGLTAARMVDAEKNMVLTISHRTEAKAAAFLEEQAAWVGSMVREHGDGDPFWATVGALTKQQDGLAAGYAVAAARLKLPAISRYDITLMSYNPDFGAVASAVGLRRDVDWLALTHQELKTARRARGYERCSALVKLTPDYSDLFMAQATWMIYGFMNRIYKMYTIDVAGHAAKTESFSSYPGVLASLDDFYAMDSGLGMVQTSTPIYNNTLARLVKPQSLVTWLRVRAANVLTRDGAEWGAVLGTNWSGTCACHLVLCVTGAAPPVLLPLPLHVHVHVTSCPNPPPCCLAVLVHVCTCMQTRISMS
eukprot:SAG22_NODE_1611_length_4001_cov_1.991287_2_plen_407_part_00